jgi:hypothetical protein
VLAGFCKAKAGKGVMKKNRLKAGGAFKHKKYGKKRSLVSGNSKEESNV